MRAFPVCGSRTAEKSNFENLLASATYMSSSADASASRHVQSLFPATTHSPDPNAAEEEETQDGSHPALGTDDEDNVGAEENEHQL
jgi:hypothetical protein